MILMIPVILLFLVLIATLIIILVRSSAGASGDGRSLSARFRESFLDVVPTPARTAASIILVGAALVGLTVGIIEAYLSTPLAVAGDHMSFLWSILGLVMGLFVGSLFAAWILGLGYVWTDARQRGMPHIPWTLIAAIVPNLLGFLLYFVLRKPLASPCPQCHQPIAAGQRFCPMCGYQALSQPAPAAPPQPV